MFGRRTNLSSLLLAGAAAYGLYRISKMSSTQRSNLISKGKSLVTDNVGNLKNVLGGLNGRSKGSPVATGNENSYS